MIRAIDLSKLRELIAIEGLGIANDIAKESPVATGDLRDSPKSTVEATDTEITLKIEAASHLKWVEGGRRAGKKMPPLDAIKAWTKVKGIPVSAAFPIAKKIAEKGITPKPILSKIIARRQDSFRDGLTKAFGEQLQILGRDLIQEFIEKKKAA